MTRFDKFCWRILLLVTALGCGRGCASAGQSITNVAPTIVITRVDTITNRLGIARLDYGETFALDYRQSRTTIVYQVTHNGNTAQVEMETHLGPPQTNRCELIWVPVPQIPPPLPTR